MQRQNSDKMPTLTSLIAECRYHIQRQFVLTFERISHHVSRVQFLRRTVNFNRSGVWQPRGGICSSTQVRISRISENRTVAAGNIRDLSADKRSAETVGRAVCSAANSEQTAV